MNEIKQAIQSLTITERAELIADLPNLLPELDGDAAWERIIRDERPRPALSALLDEAQAEFRRKPSGFRETSDAEFDREA